MYKQPGNPFLKYSPIQAKNAEGKEQGSDGRACWKGFKFAGTENGIDKCVPMQKGDPGKKDSTFDYSSSTEDNKKRYKTRKPANFTKKQHDEHVTFLANLKPAETQQSYKSIIQQESPVQRRRKKKSLLV